MFIIIYKYLIPKGYKAITLYPFIVIKEKGDKNNLVLIQHERIHIRQQIELLILPFYFVYFLDYLIKLIRYQDKYKAYRNIIFEREAYANEKNTDYLSSRPFWAWRKYL